MNNHKDPYLQIMQYRDGRIQRSIRLYIKICEIFVEKLEEQDERIR